jgi:hypothetical protein
MRILILDKDCQTSLPLVEASLDLHKSECNTKRQRKGRYFLILLLFSTHCQLLTQILSFAEIVRLQMNRDAKKGYERDVLPLL